MPESGRYGGDVEGVEWGAWRIEDGRVVVRTWI